MAIVAVAVPESPTTTNYTMVAQNPDLSDHSPCPPPGITGFRQGRPRIGGGVVGWCAGWRTRAACNPQPHMECHSPGRAHGRAQARAHLRRQRVNVTVWMSIEVIEVFRTS
jgi:hypothetical protein|eukprot:COSAG06_NODE_1258_length_10078_cov_2.895280_3_plen_111_part_00